MFTVKEYPLIKLKIKIVVDNVHSAQKCNMYIINYSTENIAFSAEYTLSTTIVILI
jgi:hypothetical protein